VFEDVVIWCGEITALLEKEISVRVLYNPLALTLSVRSLFKPVFTLIKLLV
jgi:hypothetical protein